LEAKTVVLDHDDMRRTLVRIAHEIVEKNPDGAIALVGIHRRGAVLGQRLHALTSELLEPGVPLGDVDIAFYRDDLTIRPSAPVVQSTHLEFPVDGRTIVIVDDVLYTGRTVRAAIDAIFRSDRTMSVRTSRPRRTSA
jgi:pyrimidine operon attenuation protein/uracil phosphoribosyltransferase